MGELAGEKLFRPITKRLDPPEQNIPEREDLYANFDRDLFEEGDIADELVNLFDDGQELLPQNEGVKPKFGKNIPLPDEDEDFLDPESGLLPDPDEEVLPGEKQRRHSDPGSQIPYLSDPPPIYSPPPSYKAKRSDETNDLFSLEKFVKQNKKNPNARIFNKKIKVFGMGFGTSKIPN